MDKQVLHIALNDKEYTIGYCCIPFHEKDKEQLFPALSEQELITATKFRVSKRALQYVAGRYCSKQALALITKERPEFSNITIGTAEWGAPYIDSSMYSGYNLSISHSDTIAAAICSPQEITVGLDIEICQPQNDALILSQLNEQEKIMISTFKEENQSTILHMLWGMKEAAGKALKTGFRLPMSLFEVSDIQLTNDKCVGQFKVLNILTGYSFVSGNIILALAIPSGCKIANSFAPVFMNVLTERV